MCAKTTTTSTEWIEAVISASLKRLNCEEVRKHQELALHRFIDGNDFFVSPPTGSGKPVCYWMLQAAFNALRDRADSISRFSTPWLHFYRVTLPIIAFHVLTEYGPETPDPFSPLHFRPRPPTREKGSGSRDYFIHRQAYFIEECSFYYLCFNKACFQKRLEIDFYRVKWSFNSFRN